MTKPKTPLKDGDYVLATKYSDGDSKDQFSIGFFCGMLFDHNGKQTDRYLVEDDNGQLFRQSGFRRCERISQRIGNLLVAAASMIRMGDATVWHWRRHAKGMRELIDHEKRFRSKTND